MSNLLQSIPARYRKGLYVVAFVAALVLAVIAIFNPDLADQATSAAGRIAKVLGALATLGASAVALKNLTPDTDADVVDDPEADADDADSDVVDGTTADGSPVTPADPDQPSAGVPPADAPELG